MPLSGDKMDIDTDNLILPVLVILLVLLAVVVIFAYFSGDTTFEMGNVYFEYPRSWAQDHTVGSFNNQTLYSEVTFKEDFQGPDGQSQTAFIVLQMLKKTEGVLNLPSTSSVMNTTNSTVGSINIGNIKATQLGNFGPDVSQKVTIFSVNDYNYVLLYITPGYALNQTEEAYNQILETFRLS